MKKYSLICLLLCAVLLMAPMSTVAYADDTLPELGTDASNPFIISALPFTESKNIEQTGTTSSGAPIYNNGTSIFYQLTAPQNGRLTVTVAGDCAFAVVLQNGTQVTGMLGVTTADLAEGDTVAIELFPYAPGTATLSITIEDFPLGSRQNPIELDFSELEKGYTFDLTGVDSIWYKVVAPETGVLNFVSTDMPWGYRLGFNGNTTIDQATVIHHYAQTGTRPITAGETFLLCAEYQAAEPDKFTVKVEYVPPFTIDDATQQIMFDGVYDVKTSDGKRIYGVEFDFAGKTVSAVDLQSNKFLGTYDFYYNLKNGALELTNSRGEKAPYTISVVEDPERALGAYLKLSYNGHYELYQLTEEEVGKLQPDEAALDLLNGKYEDIFLGEVYETFNFVYELDEVDKDGNVVKVGQRYAIVAPDWESEGVVYYIKSYSVFTGYLVMESEDGDVITMNAIGGQIIYNENVLTALHEHKYSKEVTYPTCTEGGYTIFTCDCGETYRGDETNPLGHNWAPATCEAPETCMNCNLTEGEALGHSWQDATCETPITCANCGLTEGEALGHNWQDATCEAPVTCANCGATEGEALGHEWSPATCETPKTCATCGATEGTAPGHSWEDATCTAPKTCYTCGATEGEALGHNWQDATCTVPKTCVNCGETEGNALGHKWNPATCTDPRTCGTCGLTEGSALGHEWIPADCENAKTCATCGATEGQALGHDWTAADCENAKTCATCGATEGQALGHDWTAADCENAKTCATCGKTEGEALGHDWNEGVVTVEPTEDSEGERIVTCQRCGLEEKRVIPNLSHVHSYASAVTAPTCESAGYTTFTCTCGDSYVEEGEAALGHAYQSVVTEATCTAGGYTTHTCDRCGDVYTDARVGALGHAYQSVVTKPTCTADGYTTHTCSRCGEEKVDTRVGATGHSYASVVTKPTCTAGGYTTHTCANCGDEYVDAKTNAKGHSYKHEVTAPTCEKEGYTAHTCTGCGEEYVDTKIQALGHSYKHEVTAPTCDQAGYTTHTCDRCGDSYQDTKVEAIGHSYDSGALEGDKITYTCTVCGHTYHETVGGNADDITVPGTLTGTVDGSATYTWTAYADGYLTIDNVGTLTGAYVTVTINGQAVNSTEDGYAVAIGDKVVITVTTYSAIEISIPVGFNDGSNTDQPVDSPMEFDVTWPADVWGGYEGSWTVPYTGTFSFVIDASNVTYEDLYFAVVTADGWGTWYVLGENFFLNADGKYTVTLTADEGEKLKIMAYEDTRTVNGELHIVVVEGEVEKHEHTFDDGVETAPTCTAEGQILYTCTVCGETKAEKLAALGHTEETIPGKAATCTETGLTDGVKCSVCGEIITEQTEIAVLDHSYGEWETVQEPTAKEDGSKKRVCSACGAEETELIPATGEMETQPTTAPTTPTTMPTTAPGTEPTTQPGGNEGGNSGVIIAVVVVVVLLAGGAVAFVIIKKKK